MPPADNVKTPELFAERFAEWCLVNIPSLVWGTGCAAFGILAGFRIWHWAIFSLIVSVIAMFGCGAISCWLAGRRARRQGVRPNFRRAFVGGFLPFFPVAAKKKTELQKSRGERK